MSGGKHQLMLQILTAICKMCQDHVDATVATVASSQQQLINDNSSVV